eukprot:8236236-Pyramimonas_sp.AAC.1
MDGRAGIAGPRCPRSIRIWSSSVCRSGCLCSLGCWTAVSLCVTTARSACRLGPARVVVGISVQALHYRWAVSPSQVEETTFPGNAQVNLAVPKVVTCLAARAR